MQELGSPDYFRNFFNSTPKIVLTFLAIGFLVYFNALFGEFVWDDQVQIVNTALTQSLANIPKIFSIGQINIFYRPVFYSFLTLVHGVFGLNVLFFHASQVGIHIANTVLVFFIFKHFIDKKLSFFLSILFLVHPINVEAVSYISAASDPLFVFFGLVAFYIMIKDKITWVALLLASLFMLLSLLAKESGFLLLMLVLAHRLFFKRAEILKTSLFAIIPTSIYFLLRFALAHTFFAKDEHHLGSIAQASHLERIITIPKIIFFYISTFFVPIKLSVAQNWVVKSITIHDFFYPLTIDLIFIGSVFYLGLLLYRQNRRLFSLFSFFVFWLLVSLGFYLQIIPLDMTVAERWFYLPIIGLLGLIGIVVHQYKIKNERLKSICFIGFIIILIIFSFRTILRNTDWATPYTLYSHDAQINKDSFDIETNLSGELIKLSRYDEALVHAKKATQLNPKSSPAWMFLGNTYAQKKDYKKAIYYYMKALENDGGNYYAFYNMVYVYILMSDYSSAKGWSETALKSFPNDPQLLLFQAIAEYKLGNEVKALELARQSYALKPTAQSQYIYMTISNKQPLNIE